LKPPSVANVKNPLPVLQKNILRGKQRLDGLRNLKTRYEKKTDRQTVEANPLCIIKELCKASKNQQGGTRKWRLPSMAKCNLWQRWFLYKSWSESWIDLLAKPQYTEQVSQS